MAAMAASFVSDHPSLRPFLLPDAKTTGKTIGKGPHGSVEEVTIPGAVCAAKKINDFYLDPSALSAVSKSFVQECELISTLRHPNIVQFLGVCFLPGSKLPAMVVEKLVTSLHGILAPEPPPPAKSEVPVSLKFSILRDVARGLSFLHSRTPPIVHRDLTAKNVLLNEGMVAKIADVAMTGITTSLEVEVVTKPSSFSVFIPPEALEDEIKPTVAVDIFSFGILSFFTLSQTFPKPLPPTYVDKKGQVIGRTELERRDSYMKLIKSQFQQGHPLVLMIQQCLKNRPNDRPTIQKVMEWLEEARAKVQDFDVNKLSLVQLLESKDKQIDQHRKTNETQKKQIDEKSEQNEKQRAQIVSLEEQVQFLQAENATLKVYIAKY